MRYSASEKLEIIRLVEQSHLPVRRTLGQIGIPRSTFYRWYDQYQTGGPEALDDRSPRPDRVWNRIPDDVRSRVVTLALDEPELSPRELAVRFTDAERYFVSEASVYRLLKAHDLITSPAFITMKAADEFTGLEGLRGEDSIAELCRREGIAQNLYYRWSKDFLEAGKKRLAGDTARAATSDEVKDLRREATALKEVVADLTLENRLLKKSVTADGEDEA